MDDGGREGGWGRQRLPALHLGSQRYWTYKSQAHIYFMRRIVSEDGTLDQKVVAAEDSDRGFCAAACGVVMFEYNDI